MILSAILLLLPRIQTPVLLCEEGKIFTADQNGSNRKLLAEGDFACWSPDQSRLVIERKNTLLLLGPDARERILWRAPENAEITGLTWGVTVAQERIATAEDQLAGSSIVFSLQSKGGSQLMQIVPERPSNPEVLTWLTAYTGFRFASVDAPAWSPSGDHLAFSVNGDLWMVNRIAPSQDLGAGGWEVGRVIAAASYDGGTNYASHWTKVVDRIAWAPNESSLSYTMKRIGGSGIEEVYRCDLVGSDEGFRASEPRLVSDESGEMFFDDWGTLHFRVGDAWRQSP